MRLLWLLIFSHLLFAAEIEVQNAWIRAMPPNLRHSAGFMILINHSQQDIELIGAYSPLINRIELHNHIHEQGMMKMRPVNSILIPAGQQVALQPGGYHLMLMKSQKPFRAGDELDIRLQFDQGDSLTITMPIIRR